MPEFQEKTAGRIRIALVILAAAGICVLWGGVVLDVLSLLFGGAVIAFLLTPLCRLFEKKLKRPLAALIALLSACAVLLCLLILLAPALFQQLTTLAELLPEAFSRLRGLIEDVVEGIRNKLPELVLPELNLGGAEQEFGGLVRNAASALGGLGDGVYRFTLMAVLSYFLMADREQILLRLELLIPSGARCTMVRAGRALVRELKLYLRGQATIALAVGALAALGLALVGVPSALLLGVFVGAFNVIPYFGPILGGIPAVVLALSQGWKAALLSILTLFLVQQIDGMVISPRVMGNVTGFSPAVVLIALFVGARLGSIAGMLFALPVLMAIRTLYRVFVQRHENN